MLLVRVGNCENLTCGKGRRKVRNVGKNEWKKRKGKKNKKSKEKRKQKKKKRIKGKKS